MSRLADPPSTRISFAGVPDAPGRTRNISVLSSSGHHSMDISPPPTGAHGTDDRMTGITNGAEAGNNSLNASNPAIGAAAAAQQPKVVQTAFIHKLYKYVFWVFRLFVSIDSHFFGKQYARRPQHPASHLLVGYKR